MNTSFSPSQRVQWLVVLVDMEYMEIEFSAVIFQRQAESWITIENKYT